MWLQRCLFAGALLANASVASAQCPISFAPVTVRFLNGIWTTKEKVANESAELEKQVRADSRWQGIETECVSFTYSWNALDLVGGYDLQHAIQRYISNDVASVLRTLVGLAPSTPAIDRAVANLANNVDTAACFAINGDCAGFMADLEGDAITVGVTHSEGNLIWNEAFTVLTSETNPRDPRRLRSVSVATPSHTVLGDYVNLSNDLVAATSGLSPNAVNPGCTTVTFECHLFLESYMTAPNPKAKILDAIFARLPRRANAAPTAGFITASAGLLPTQSSPPAATVPTITATADVFCSCAAFSFDGRAPSSSDPDGFVASWRWSIDGTAANSDRSLSLLQQSLFAGNHTVSLVVTDNDGASSPPAKANLVVLPATVTLPPVAINDGPFLVPQGGGYSLAAPGVLTNDTFPSGARVEFISPLPSWVSAANSDGSLALNFATSPTLTGSFSLQYVIRSSAGDSNLANVEVSVLPSSNGRLYEQTDASVRQAPVSANYYWAQPLIHKSSDPDWNIRRIILPIAAVDYGYYSETQLTTAICKLFDMSFPEHSAAWNGSGSNISGSFGEWSFTAVSADPVANICTFDIAANAVFLPGGRAHDLMISSHNTIPAHLMPLGSPRTGAADGFGYISYSYPNPATVIPSADIQSMAVVLCSDPACTVTFNTTSSVGGAASDNFNGSSIDGSKWTTVIVPTGIGTVLQSNQRLEVRNTSAGAFYEGLQGKCSVGGDFDVQVDYALLNWPAQSFSTVRLGAMDLDQGPTGITGVYRNSFNIEDYQFRAVSGVVANVSRSDSTGRLKLVRGGSTIFGYYWNGAAFVLMGSAPTSTLPTRFLIDVANGGTSAPVGVQVAFDNFQVKSGTVTCPAPQWTLTPQDVLRVKFRKVFTPPTVNALGFTPGASGSGVSGSTTTLYNFASRLGRQSDASPSTAKYFRSATSAWPFGQVIDFSSFTSSSGGTDGLMDYQVSGGSAVIDPALSTVSIGSDAVGGGTAFEPADITGVEIDRITGSGMRVEGGAVFVRSLLPDSYPLTGLADNPAGCITLTIHKGTFPSTVSSGVFISGGNCSFYNNKTWGYLMDDVQIYADSAREIDNLLYANYQFPREDSDYWFEFNMDGTTKTVATLSIRRLFVK